MDYINLETELPIPEPLLRLEELQQTILYDKGIQIVKGKANSGKTFYLSFLMSKLTNKKILFAETFKSPHNTYEIIKRVHRLNKWECNKNCENLIGVNLNIYSRKEQFSILEKAIEEVRPNVLFLDNIEETNNNLSRMMQWSARYNLSIVAVVNTITKESEKSRNTWIEQTDTIIDITRDLNIISVTEQKREERREGDSIKFFLEIKDKLPVVRKSGMYDTEEERLKIILENVLTRIMTVTELATAIAKYADRCQSTGFNYIKKALASNLIRLDNKGKYVL